MPRRLLFIISILIFGACHAQIPKDSIRFEKIPMSYHLYQGDFRVGPNRAGVVMKNCPDALSNYSNGRKLEAVSTAMFVVGVITTTATLGSYYFNKPNSNPNIKYGLAAGIAMIGISIPLYKQGLKKIETSAFLFNKNCSSTPRPR